MWKKKWYETNEKQFMKRSEKYRTDYLKCLKSLFGSNKTQKVTDDSEKSRCESETDCKRTT
jgi:hypothetical protein